MRIAYLDCFSGISGDMFLGALVDSGVSTKLLEYTVASLDVGAHLEISRVERSGIAATKVDVYCHGEKDLPREKYWAQQKAAQESAKPKHEHHSHSHHEHGHEHNPVQLVEHNYGSAGQEPAAPAHEHHHGRILSEIREIIARAAISSTAQRTAIAIFEALGAAEAKIHSTDIDKVHFHEVGAVDAMVDIVCASVGAEALDVDEIVCSPLNVGGGTVKCAHGTFPIPAPATLEILKGAPIYSSGIEAELVTPTGAAIVKTLASRFSQFPRMTVASIGYGAGTRDSPGYPNVLRLTIGEAVPQFEWAAEETITVLEANLDDLNPQVFGYVMDTLLEQGALDVFATPVQMKKNRPGMLMSVLCKAENASKLTQVLFAETTTLGVRQRDERRSVLARKWVDVSTRWGKVRIKIASMNGGVTNYAPEYEDCRSIASEHHVPLKTVIEEAVQVYLRNGKE